MSSLMKKLLNGFSNTNSTESSGEKEVKVYNIKTNVAEVLGEDPNMPDAELDNLLTAAIAIETMMSMDSALYENNAAGISEPTIH